MTTKRMLDSPSPIVRRRRTPAAYGRDLGRYGKRESQKQKLRALEETRSCQVQELLDKKAVLAVLRYLLDGNDDAGKGFGALTLRERQIVELVLAGHRSKNIAEDLGINQRTVENHRASIMKKTGAKSIPALTRLALAALCKDALGART